MGFTVVTQTVTSFSNAADAITFAQTTEQMLHQNKETQVNVQVKDEATGAPVGFEVIVEKRRPRRTEASAAGCQISNPRLQETLACKATDSHGLQCENTQNHKDEHQISEHTQAHSLAGNAYPCSAIS